MYRTFFILLRSRNTDYSFLSASTGLILADCIKRILIEARAKSRNYK